MMAVMEDLRTSMRMCRLIFYLPSEPGMWIAYETSEWDEVERAKAIHGWSELDLVKFRVAGIPLAWKIVNFLTILLPKLLIWMVLCSSGFRFLMESAAIVDLIVNAMALAFILSIDEMVLSALATSTTHYIMEHMEDYPLFSTESDEVETDESCLSRYQSEE